MHKVVNYLKLLSDYVLNTDFFNIHGIHYMIFEHLVIKIYDYTISFIIAQLYVNYYWRSYS